MGKFLIVFKYVSTVQACGNFGQLTLILPLESSRICMQTSVSAASHESALPLISHC